MKSLAIEAEAFIWIAFHDKGFQERSNENKKQLNVTITL